MEGRVAVLIVSIAGRYDYSGTDDLQCGKKMAF